MASALEKIMKGTLQKSDAQKAFSPWWEALEDKMLYTLMILGMISLPFNMVSNTPVECTLNQRHPTFKNLTEVENRPVSQSVNPNDLLKPIMTSFWKI